MSIIGSISNCKKPIGSGMSRSAYYSKKYKCVIKIPKAYDDIQTKQEKALFEKMTPEEREYFPIKYFVDYKGKLCVIMHKCEPLEKYLDTSEFDDEYCGSLDDEEEIQMFCERYGFSEKNADMVVEIVSKYHINDLHFGNLAVYKDKLVIIDAGIIGKSSFTNYETISSSY